jgi:AcrR family transcriptional regulator
MTNQPPDSGPRHRLLDRVIEEIAANGLGDRSLREIASAIGSSHRMLLYHFGSRPGLLAAVVDEIEHRQRAAMTTEVGSARAARAMWRRVSDPALRPFVALFFELAGQAHRLPISRTADDMTQPWIDEAVRVAAQASSPLAAADVRLGVAVVRGLLVDVVTGGDPHAADEAFERYLAMMSAGG